MHISLFTAVAVVSLTITIEGFHHRRINYIANDNKSPELSNSQDFVYHVFTGPTGRKQLLMFGTQKQKFRKIRGLKHKRQVPLWDLLNVIQRQRYLDLLQPLDDNGIIFISPPKEYNNQDLRTILYKMLGSKRDDEMGYETEPLAQLAETELLTLKKIISAILEDM